MINLSTDNRQLLLNIGTDITIREISPLFDSDISGTAYPISIPAGENMQALQFMHRPGTQLRQLPIYMEYGSHYRSMLGIVTKASPKGYELSLKLDDSIFKIQNGDKNIRDIDMGITTTFQDIIDDPAYFRSRATNKFCVPEIVNLEFLKDVFVDPSKIRSQNNFLNSGEYSPITPFFFLKDVIASILSNGGYAIRGGFDDLFNRTFIYSNTSIYNYINDNSGMNGKVNPKHHLPDMTIKEFLIDVCEYFNFKMIFDHSGKTVKFVSMDNIVAQPATDDLSEYAISDFTLTDIDISEHITYQHEVESADIDSPWQADQQFDSSSTNTYPTGQPVGTRHLLTDENCIYRYNEDSEGAKSWEKYSIYYPIIVVGNESAKPKEFKTKFSALARKTISGNVGVAHAGYKGNTRARTESVQHAKRFGILTDSGTAKVSTATQSLVTGSFAGAINDRYQRTFQWYLAGRRRADITIALPIWKLFGLDMTRKYTVNGVSFFFEELNYKLTNNGIEYSPAKVCLV